MRKPIISMYERLHIRPNPETGKWVLLEPFTFYRGNKNSGKGITIPAGFEFDGASVPRLFWFVGHPMGIDTLIAALVHDYLYSIQTLTREEVDDLFNEIMLICEVETLKRMLFYLGVRVGGGFAWNNHKKHLQNL